MFEKIFIKFQQIFFCKKNITITSQAWSTRLLADGVRS